MPPTTISSWQERFRIIKYRGSKRTWSRVLISTITNARVYATHTTRTHTNTHTYTHIRCIKSDQQPLGAHRIIIMLAITEQKCNFDMQKKSYESFFLTICKEKPTFHDIIKFYKFEIKVYFIP